MDGSHKFFERFFEEHPDERADSLQKGDLLRPMQEEYLKWYRQLGCLKTRVPVPRGSLLLWDSRLVHDNARPIKGRWGSPLVFKFKFNVI
jgi:hypothetical protein